MRMLPVKIDISKLTTEQLQDLYRMLVQEADAPDRIRDMDNFVAQVQYGHRTIRFGGNALQEHGVLFIDEAGGRIFVPVDGVGSSRLRTVHKVNSKLGVLKESLFPRRAA